MKAYHFIAIFFIMSFGCANKHENQIRVYPDQIISTNFIGNGVQWSAYPHADSENAEWGNLMTDEKWQMNFERLDYMKPKFFRVMDQANWRYLVGFDENNEPILDFTTPEVQAVERIFDYAQKNDIVVLLGEWGTPYAVHDQKFKLNDMFTGADDPKWISCIVKYLDYLINTKGYTCIKYYNLVNEPNGFWASTDGRWDEWSAGAKLLANALKESGLDEHVSIAGPDAVAHCDHPTEKYTGMQWVEESVAQLNDELGVLEIHAYFKNHIIREAQFDSIYRPLVELAKSVDKQIIFGEIGFDKSIPENVARVEADPYASEDSYMFVYDFSYGIDMADALIQIMNTGFSGAAAWDLDDAMHTKDDLGDKTQLKRWGMWNSLGTEICNNPEDENIRPWFYSWSLMCRYFPAGSSIVKTDTTGIEGIRLTASVYKDDLSIAIVNNSTQDNNISITIPSLKPLKKFLYFESGMKVDENNFPMPIEEEIEGSMELHVPANSFILLTSYNF